MLIFRGQARNLDAQRSDLRGARRFWLGRLGAAGVRDRGIAVAPIAEVVFPAHTHSSGVLAALGNYAAREIGKAAATTRWSGAACATPTGASASGLTG